MSWLEFQLFQRFLWFVHEKLTLREAVSAIQTNLWPKMAIAPSRQILKKIRKAISNPDKIAKNHPDKNPEILTFWKHPLGVYSRVLVPVTLQYVHVGVKRGSQKVPHDIDCYPSID